MKSNWNLVLVVLVFPLAFSVFADTFLLKDGKTIVGTQVEKTDNSESMSSDLSPLQKEFLLIELKRLPLIKKQMKGNPIKNLPKMILNTKN